jgi:nitroimidazol reductase NimA-like FMN-containing flavoprotein (pyridoxamine 5'-phosphate oxidase superfamily)
MIKTITKEESLAILRSNYIGNLAYIYNNQPYIVPMTYYFDEEINAIICYTAEGHKIKAMRKYNVVSFEVTDIKSIDDWISVLVEGVFEELSGSNSKLKLHQFSLGIKNIIKEKEEREVDTISDFSSKIYKSDLPIAFLIKIDQINGKKRNYFGYL